MLEEAGDTLRGAWCMGQWLATPRCGFCFAHPWPLILQTPPPPYFLSFVCFCMFGQPSLRLVLQQLRVQVQEPGLGFLI